MKAWLKIYPLRATVFQIHFIFFSHKVGIGFNLQNLREPSAANGKEAIELILISF